MEEEKIFWFKFLSMYIEEIKTLQSKYILSIKHSKCSFWVKFKALLRQKYLNYSMRLKTVIGYRELFIHDLANREGVHKLRTTKM